MSDTSASLASAKEKKPRTARVKKEPKPKKPKAPRYSIAEWYGKDITKLTPDQRKSYGAIALKQDTTKSLAGAPACPFMAALAPAARCNKYGGVCSIRPFNEELDEAGEKTGAGYPTPGYRVVTVCPSRFLQLTTDSFAVLGTVAKTMLGTDTPTIIKETPFLKKLDGAAVSIAAPEPIEEPTDAVDDPEDQEEEDLAKMAGRIDWILADASDIENGGERVEWCALEIQSVYFSGKAMGPEFAAYANGTGQMLYPIGHRRPDYRSSGPKRLAPQLNVKVPVMAGWGTKVAVVVDAFFFSNMSDMPDADPRAKSLADKLGAAAVVWFVVDYDESMDLFLDDNRFAKLEHSVEALNATAPVQKTEFNQSLRSLIKESLRPGNTKLGTKVFKINEPIAEAAAEVAKVTASQEARE